MQGIEAILYVPSDTPEAMSMATAKVAGVPTIVRGLMTLASAGINKQILLIAHTQRERIEKFLARYEDRKLPDIEIISYDEPYRVSPDIIKRISTDTQNRCLLINANFIFDKELVQMIRSLPLEENEVITCREGIHPLPIMDVSPNIWNDIEKFTEERPRSIESCINKINEIGTPRIAQKPASMNTFLIRRMRDRPVAEKFLTEAIRNSTSGPIAKYINKRFSLPASLLLSKLWISPNTVTVFNIIIGLFSGVFVADGKHYDVILFGAALFQIASIIDGCDGEVGKLTFRCSKFGQYIDSLSDNLSLASFLIGLIAGYWRHTHSPVAFYVGALLLVTTIITFFWMIKFLKQNTQSASFVTYDKEYLQRLSNEPGWLIKFIKYGKYFLKKDVFSFTFLLFALAGVLYWVLFIATFGTTLAAVILTYLNLQNYFKGTSSKNKQVKYEPGTV